MNPSDRALSTVRQTLGADASVVDGDGCTAALVAQRSGQVLCQETLGPTFGARPAGPAACRERGFGRLAADASPGRGAGTWMDSFFGGCAGLHVWHTVKYKHV